MLAILLNVPVSKFSNRHFKEDCVINIPTLDYSLSAFNEESDILSDSKFNKLVKNLDPSLTHNCSNEASLHLFLPIKYILLNV